jgi:serine/threonine protein kinase
MVLLGYIVMELGGDNLTKLIERSRGTHHGPGGPGTYTDPVLRQEAWRQLVSIVRTLTANRIVHMDLKPDNIIAFGPTLKIADLGISKKADMLGYETK